MSSWEKYESLNHDHFLETLVDIRDAKWFIHIRMHLWPSISINSTNKGVSSEIRYEKVVCTVRGYTLSERYFLEGEGESHVRTLENPRPLLMMERSILPSYILLFKQKY